ncbi:signal peptidase II [Actinocorallia sp. A-T 12471]|uniref:signal peptidase II n=1 Tax=Actinocorallia sp. A-T 12471 TaxID=3089813 RepID=UPI0029D084D8|nr:signal peptidase II [Actinocorallia sp. A-T 12471]MDX6743060.1 signal peptidase II [Actinocorallia sp. A-T 12471]
MFGCVAAAAVLIDQVTKAVVVATLEGQRPIELPLGLSTLRVVRNAGAAFSIGTGMTWVFTIIALGVTVAIVRYAKDLRSTPWAVTLGLLLGGAAGNLIDRLVRAPGHFQGHVVDWIEWPTWPLFDGWPVYNLADTCIVFGGIFAVVLAGLGYQPDGTRETKESREPEAEEPEAKELEAEESRGTAAQADGVAEIPADGRTADKASADAAREGGE